MDWILVIFVTFKVGVFGTGMFFAIKWHHEQGKKKRNPENNVGAAGTRPHWTTDLF